MDPVAVSRTLVRKLKPLRFAAPAAYVYNPLEYARQPHELYLRTWGMGPRDILLLGMNPGPFGMAQTGVPFGEISFVRDWLGIQGAVGKPPREHPRRPVDGFSCARSEVSGARLWGWAKDYFRTPENFFARFMVVNYCPLAFMEESGKNLTPDKLPTAPRAAVLGICDSALRSLVAYYRPRWVLGVGAWAMKRAVAALGEDGPRIAAILHPSPASPLANKGWAPQVERRIGELGINIGARHRCVAE